MVCLALELVGLWVVLAFVLKLHFLHPFIDPQILRL